MCKSIPGRDRKTPGSITSTHCVSKKTWSSDGNPVLNPAGVQPFDSNSAVLIGTGPDRQESDKARHTGCGRKAAVLNHPSFHPSNTRPNGQSGVCPKLVRALVRPHRLHVPIWPSKPRQPAYSGPRMFSHAIEGFFLIQVTTAGPSSASSLVGKVALPFLLPHLFLLRGRPPSQRGVAVALVPLPEIRLTV